MKQVLLALVLLCALAASGRASDGTTVAASATQDITAFSVCKRVTNNTGSSLYVPTTSAGEWSSFYDHPTASVSIADCPTSCAGASLGGYCWYTATAYGQSCDTVCASHGGATNGATNYAGTGGTLANCSAVVVAVTGTAWPASDNATASYGGIGCAMVLTAMPPPIYVMSSPVRATAVATTNAATFASGMRYCSCAQ